MVKTISKKIKFVDTNILLSHLDQIEKEDFFMLSSIALTELEDIKTNRNKSDDIKYAARKAVRFLGENSNKYKIIVYDVLSKCDFMEYGLEDSPDNRIIRCAEYAKNILNYDIVFVSNDILARLIAKDYFHLEVSGLSENIEDDYKGYIEVILSDDEMVKLYSDLNTNHFGLITNQYLIIKNEMNEVVDRLKWTGNTHEIVKVPNIKSTIFGNVKPYKGDVYQLLTLNSMCTNQVTMIKGAAGTGKSYLSIGYLLYLLDKHKIDKIVIFANPVPTANSARIGFLPGTQLDKLIDSSVGNMLSCKLGDKYMIEQLVAQNKLVILPMCDIRGFDTGGLNCGVYITEAQNMDISLMKLALQRIGEDSICIVEGDYNAQVDLSSYSGNNNGMKRMSEVFRGHSLYGEVELQNIYRSKIAEIAEQM